MDEVRKNAYRNLLYVAMLDIRHLCPFWDSDNNDLPAWQSQVSGAIAYWLHNLAFYSSQDFNGFDEDMFWKSYDSTQRRFPQFSLNHYQQAFQKYIDDPEHRK